MTAPIETPDEPGPQYRLVTVMPLGGSIGGLFNTGASWPVLGCQICGALVPGDQSWADNPTFDHVHENSGHTRWHQSMGQTWPVAGMTRASEEIANGGES